MSLMTWLNETLRHRGLSRPDGRWLYAYRLDLNEYRALKDALVEVVRVSPAAALPKNRFFCGAFVLYASEWWRREYAGGPWRWGPILASIGMEDGAMPPHDRTDAVLGGFAYWVLRPAREGKRYFGSVVAHGGLPLNAIRHGGGANLGSVMGTVLRQASRYQWNALQIADAVGDHANALPRSLQERVIYELVAQMVLTVLRLKTDFKLDGASDPVGLLDSKCPGWKNEFPISVDDASALQLLIGLVKEANRAVPGEYRAPFVVDRSISAVAEGVYELQSSIGHPASVLGDALAAFAGLSSADDLPGHFHVDVSVGGRMPLTAARTILGAATHTIAFAPQKQRWSGEVVCNEHLIHLRANAGDLLAWPVSIPGGEPLASDEPWVFAMRDDLYRFVATGDARLPDQTTLVAVCDGWSVHTDSDVAAPPSEFGKLRIGGVERVLMRVDGSVRVESCDESWVIKVGQVSGFSSQLVLEGSRVPLQTSPCPLFRGMPQVVAYSEDGSRSVLSPKSYKAFRAGSKEPFHVAASAGLVDLIVEEGGERLGRLRFGVIDKHSKETYVSGEDPARGHVVLSGWGEVSIGCGASDAKLAVVAQGHERRIELVASDKPPSHVLVHFKWPGSRTELKARLPFPASGGRAYDEFDNPITSGSTLTLARLTGKGIRVFDSNPNHPKKYEIELRLSSRQPGLSVPNLKLPVALKSGAAEVRLAEHYRDIESLLGFSDELDAEVTVILRAGGVPVLDLRVSRYDARLDRNLLGLRLPAELIAKLSVDELGKVEALAVPLSDPAASSVRLPQHTSEGVPTGTWVVADLPVKGSPWLVFPAETSPVFFRPTVALGAREQDVFFEETAQHCDLALAMRHGDGQVRAKAIEAVVEAMASDFNAPSWEMLDQIWLTFRRLPLCSLDAYRLIARRPDLAVAMLFASRLPSAELLELVRRLRVELGLTLEIAPISSWRKAVASLRHYWVKRAGEEAASALFGIVLGERLRNLADELANQRLILDMLMFEAGGDPSPLLAEVSRSVGRGATQYGKGLWSGENSLVMRYLLRAHVDDGRWPEVTFGNDIALRALFEALDENSLRIIRGNVSNLFWHASGDFKESVANMPAVCALWAACDVSIDWWRSTAHQYSLRTIRAFDPVWFDECYRQSLASCFAFELIKPRGAISGTKKSESDAPRKIVVRSGTVAAVRSKNKVTP
ncbi:MAG: STY4851/ECs_5259 family protein [Azoarcus sp.]|nr:STY4851/ECs_5259 family protein [Azoarcus sp.]